MIGFFGLLILSCQSPTKKFEKPNVIIILADDLSKDITETQNIADSHEILVKDMQATIDSIVALK